MGCIHALMVNNPATCIDCKCRNSDLLFRRRKIQGFEAQVNNLGQHNIDDHSVSGSYGN